MKSMDTNIILSKNQLLELTNQSTNELITIVAKRDNLSLAIYEKRLTVGIAMNGTSISSLIKTIDEKNITKILVFLIDRFSSNFNVGKKFTDEQAIIMAMDLSEVFKYETIEDFVLMLRMARMGQIGDGKDYKLDSQTVFHKWIPEYLNLKTEQRERLIKAEKEKLFGNNLTLDDVRKAYAKKISAQKIEDDRNARIDELTKDFTREDLENLISEWTIDDVKKKYLRYLTKKRLTIK